MRAFALVLLLVIAGCSRPEPSSGSFGRGAERSGVELRLNSGEEFRTSFYSVAPKGTSIHKAESILSRSGFTCIRTNGTYAGLSVVVLRATLPDDFLQNLQSARVCQAEIVAEGDEVGDVAFLVVCKPVARH